VTGSEPGPPRHRAAKQLVPAFSKPPSKLCSGLSAQAPKRALFVPDAEEPPYPVVSAFASPAKKAAFAEYRDGTVRARDQSAVRQSAGFWCEEGVMRSGTSAVIASFLASVTVAGLAFAQEKPRFEETIVVTATPRAGSPSEYVLHFSGPVQVPGRTLPTGSYLFRFPTGTTRVIQVLKADRSNEYAMFHTIDVVDVNRMPPGGTDANAHRVTFRERTAPGMAPAIREWFVPGRSSGWEFVYTAK
jgi:hypothetical protein